jgi:hypothetical protein
MRILLPLNRGLAFICVMSATMMCAPAAFGCDRLPAGQSLWIRLAAPVSTYTAKVGDSVHAVLTQDLVCDNDVVLPMGATVDGVVRSKRKVGWGIRHETAALELEFNRAIAGPGAVITLTARVEEVENARELVRNGVIQGIRSSDTFQGSINSHLIHLPTWNLYPYSDPVLIAYKATFPIFPEPEIYYPVGTDIHLRTTSEVSCPPEMVGTVHESSPADKEETDRLDQLVDHLPWRVTTKKDVDADLLNLVFIGSEDQVKAAFRESGWHNAEHVSRRTVWKQFYSLLNNSGYAQQPMITFYLNSKPEDMNWQRNLNSYGRRDHLRMWEWTPEDSGERMWVGSSTHDSGAVLSVKYRGFVHHISPDVDDERSAVIRSLNFAGCVKSVNYVLNPEMRALTHNAIGDVMVTDKSVAVIALRDCRPADPELDSNSKGGIFKPGNYAFRYIRKQILTFRSDILRANIIYGAYEAGRMAVTALRHQPAPPQPSGPMVASPRVQPAASEVGQVSYP